MAKKTQITDELRATFAELAAEGLSNVKIAERTGISRYSVGKLRKDHEANIAIDRVRMTETLPRQMTAIANAMDILAETVAGLRNDVADVNSTNKRICKAMHRLQVENKNLREDRKKARDDLRRLRHELWKVRGY